VNESTYVDVGDDGTTFPFMCAFGPVMLSPHERVHLAVLDNLRPMNMRTTCAHCTMLVATQPWRTQGDGWNCPFRAASAKGPLCSVVGANK
jgi:hypothetical protein